MVPRQIPADGQRRNPAQIRREARTDAEQQAAARDRVSLALLLLRGFLGLTFIYAGLDKLIDPTFLRAAGAGSIGAQLEAFTHGSPVGLLVQVFARPFPLLTGLVISVTEIAIGLGALTGLLFRLVTVAGAALSILFWLTASWSIKPYYYGPDLPYAAGWVTLAIAGHGGRYVLDEWLARWVDPLGSPGEPMSAERRHFLQGGILGFGALALATLGGTLGSTIFGRPASGVGLDASPAPGTGPGEASLSPTAAPAGTVLGTVATLASQGGSLIFQDPHTGDPGVVVKLANGKFVAFDAVCTHAGCTVEFDSGSGYLYCPCHGATFDPAHKAAVLAGPTNVPLTGLPITVDARTGVISLVG